MRKENPSATDFQGELASGTLRASRYLKTQMNRPTEAMQSYDRSREIYERLVREHPSVTDFQVDLADNNTLIGHLQGITGRPDEALASCERAREILERLVREKPSVAKIESPLARVPLQYCHAATQGGPSGEGAGLVRAGARDQ